MPDVDADLTGEVSPPRDNGEIVFAEPWERRAFGVAVELCRSGTLEWEAFRQRLIARIAEDAGRVYWQSWALALEDALAAVLVPGDIDARHVELLARPAGHDHGH